MKTILECVVGSTAHGTSVDDGLEDLDLMSIVIERPVHRLGFVRGAYGLKLDAALPDTWIERTKPEGVRSEAGDVDYVKHGLRKFVELAFKNNPSILLMFFAPTRVCTVEGVELRNMADKFICRQAYKSFGGFMDDQFKRLTGTQGQKNVTRPELIEAYGFDTKYAGHIVRLGYQGTELLRTGRITMPMPERERQHVVDVRTGKYSLRNITEQIKEIQTSLAWAGAHTALRAEPDFVSIETWMIAKYLDYWEA